ARLARVGGRSSMKPRHIRGARAIALGAVLGLAAVPALAAPAADPIAARVDKVLAKTPLIDGHNDLPWEIRARFKNDLSKIDLSKDTAGLPRGEGDAPIMTDIPRLRAGRVGGQFWSVWIPVEVTGPAAVQTTVEQIDVVKAMAARYPNDFAMAYTAADV